MLLLETPEAFKILLQKSEVFISISGVRSISVTVVKVRTSPIIAVDSHMTSNPSAVRDFIPYTLATVLGKELYDLIRSQLFPTRN